MIRKIVKGIRRMKKEVVRDSVEMFEAKTGFFELIAKDKDVSNLVGEICLSASPVLTGLGVGVCVVGVAAGIGLRILGCHLIEK